MRTLKPSYCNIAKVLLLTLAVIIAPIYSFADDAPEPVASGKIVIKGAVYGGGRMGYINTGNAEGTTTDALENITITTKTTDAANVNIYNGEIGNIFGGGANGRSFGVTKVTLNGTDVHITGNVFGAGEGQGAAVMGGSLVHLKNGMVEGAIYGGADAALVVGQTQVHVQGGSAIRALFAGSRAADIYGNTFAWIDGKNALNNIRIGNLYGGNDVTGNIQSATIDNWSWVKAVNLRKPDAIEIPNKDATPALTYKPGAMFDLESDDAEKNLNNRNAFVYVSNPEEGTTSKGKLIEVSSAFVGGNGEGYDYASHIVDEQETNPYAGKTKPVLERGYIQIEGGTFGSVFGGGNAATVSKSTDIFINNKDLLSKYKVKDFQGNYLDADGNITTDTEKYITRLYQFGRVFGGNNKEDMFIRPTWFLQEGSICDLYSGGNAGAMRYYDPATQHGGIFLAIESEKMTINNVYGGCRIADVAPITESVFKQKMATTIDETNTLNTVTTEVTAEIKAWLKDAVLAEIAAGSLTGIDPTDETAVNNEVDRRFALDANRSMLTKLVDQRMETELMATRQAAVYEEVSKTYLAEETMYGYTFQPDYATRVLVRGGNINNVYGGNDVSGLVFNGAQVEIHSSINNNVYGAGNGDYKYWNNLQAANVDQFDPDLYFNSTSIFASRRKWVASVPDQYDYQRYLQALNLYRPDVKRSYVHLVGTRNTAVPDDAEHYHQQATTIIGGAVYAGGNSTTLGVLNTLNVNEDLGIEGHIQFGSYVRAENVFMGSNGENLVTDDIMRHFTSDAFSAGTDQHLSLLTPELMATYMKAVEVPIRCTTGFDESGDERNINNQDAKYADYSTWIGSLFIGGNVGSMSYPGQFDVNFDHKIMIYDKLVAGCNKANVDYKPGQNAFFAGGITTALTGADANKPKILLNLNGIRLDPYWYKPKGDGTFEFVKHYYYEDTNEHMDVNEFVELTDEDKATKKGGNIYGGCYESGHVNGGVEINVNANVLYTGYEYDGVNYHPDSPYDVLSSRLSAYGGGYGLDTEIWGDVNINVNARGQILKVFGGGEKGVVGKIKRDETTGKYKYTNATDNILDVETPYNTLVQVAGSQLGVEGGTVKNPWDDGRLYDVMRVYGGGYEGHVTGHTVVKLGRAKVHSAFGGACNADIYDFSRIIVGQKFGNETDNIAEATGETHLTEVPCVTENLYGGNDFGGRILGYQTINAPESSLQPSDALYYTGIDNTDLDRLSLDETAATQETAPTTVFTQSYVEYHRGKIHGNIFGGASGNYRYIETYRDMFEDDHMLGADGTISRVDGAPFYAPNMLTKVNTLLSDDDKQVANSLAVNSFVNVVCETNEYSRDVVLGNNIVSEVSTDCDDESYQDAATTTTTTTGAELEFKLKKLKEAGGIFGGSEGLTGRRNRADQEASYVRLASLKTRERALAPNVFGGGFCSRTANSLVDAFSGRYGNIFGGAYGMTFEEKKWVSERAVNVANNYSYRTKSPRLDAASFTELTSEEKTQMLATYQRTRYAGDVSKVRVHDINTPESDIFGAGANAGSMESFVELYAGKVNDVYGASLDQGYTAAANVYIPKGSVTSVKEIFGGAKGSNHRYMCDVSNAFVALHSDKIDVRGGQIYGGNNKNRFTRSSFIEMDVAPTFKDENDNDELLTIYGGGKGENSVGTFTTVSMLAGAKAKNVFGGSYEGRILSSPALRFYCMEEGERVPWYDPQEKLWKIAEGESRYFSNDVYEYGNKVGTITVPLSESGFDFETFFVEDATGTIEDINGKKFKSDSSPVWERFIASVEDNTVKIKGVNNEELSIYTKKDLETYLFEKIPNKKYVAPTGETERQFAISWPGYTKYKFAPETREYHDWTTRLGRGKYREHVFQAERGEPGEVGYVAEKFDYFDYPAYQAKGFTTLSPLYELGQTTFTQNNTKIRIYEGAEVIENVYGAGYGAESVVAGNTDVRLLGGRVYGNIYGGGMMGSVKPQAFVRVYDNEVQTGHTSVLLTGGSVSKAYGGGLQGDVYGYAETTIGFEDPVNLNSDYQYYPEPEPNLSAGLGETEIFRPVVYRYGDPCVELNVYGGGEKGKVDCMANLIINKGHIGYRFDPTMAGDDIDVTNPEVRATLATREATPNSGYANKLSETLAKCYVENVDPERKNDPLAHFGNAFAGGYGEGANTFYTHLWMYGGVVRNSIYGGGEIASVGIGPSDIGKPTESESLLQGLTRAANVGKEIRDTSTPASPGYTHVVMVGGEVHGNVFGGGRGYTYDLESGNQGYGDEDAKIYSDGYVFGNTHVSIRGGVIGTDETLYSDDPKGNVFGGGNIGYVFTGAVKCVQTDTSAKDYESNNPYLGYQNLLVGAKTTETPNGFEYIVDRYYTNEWLCQNCGTAIKCYLEPHACWACQKHSMPSAHYDYTDFVLALKVEKDANGNYLRDPATGRFKEKASFNAATDHHLVLTEDCRVVVTPYLRVTDADGITFPETTTVTDVLPARTFKYNEYVPPRYLNTLKNKTNTASAEQWAKMNTDGIIIRNAVFAGGNVSRGSSKIYANATTVFGNATATLNDIYYRDFITLGEEGIGGLYGDGNLTFVDGYRELNITNFGTDYDYIETKNDGSISYDEFYDLTDREKAYFRVEFKCVKNGGVATYSEGDVIDEATYRKLAQSDRYSNEGGAFTWYWEPLVLGAYEGRMMNTIQRADFCGVFGSRITLMGAQDRVIDRVDPKLYTINRLGELSLNMQRYEKEKPELSPYDLDNGEKQNIHGNYFGIYNVVNYLGGITSDMRMTDKRHTTNANQIYQSAANEHEYDSAAATYLNWKDANKNNNRIRNNGNSLNKIALANGVYLEVVREPKDKSIEVEQTADEDKDYGYITGVVELDLINVTTGAGGGYVYAKNEHGNRVSEDTENFNAHVLSVYNAQARTSQAISYSTTNLKEYETSGNFVHPTKQILDDCWPNPNHYSGDDAANGHYWYIKGNYYVYDQIVQGVAGSITPSQVSINLPLSITLGSRGKLDLINVQPNLYAYYQTNGSPLTADATLVVGNGNSTGAGLMQTGTPYKLNQPITYWDWSLLTSDEQKCFVPMTYIVADDFYRVDNNNDPVTDASGNPIIYSKGTVYLPSEVDAMKAWKVVSVNDITETVYGLSEYVRMSNEISHNNGYAVDVSFNNPMPWDNWYSDKYSDADHEEHYKLNKFDYSKKDPDLEQPNYILGPSYMCEKTGVYGQYEYKVGAIITQKQVTAYTTMKTSADNAVKAETSDHTATFTFANDQAKLEPCYVTTNPIEYTYDDKKYSWQAAGVGIPESQYNGITNPSVAITTAIEPAYYCTSTYLIPNTASDYIYRNQLIGENRLNSLVVPYMNYYNANRANATDPVLADPVAARDRLLDLYFSKAYYVTDDGCYDGTYFQSGKRYQVLDSWCALDERERENFSFEYDAFDIISQSDAVAENSENTVDWITNGTNTWPMYPGYKVAGIDHENNVPGYMPYYDGYWFNNRATDLALAPYSQTQRVDYNAYWRGHSESTTGETIVFTTTDEHKDVFAAGRINGKQVTITEGRGDKDRNVLSREEFEAIPNEKAHYVAITTTNADKQIVDGVEKYVKYVVKSTFTLGPEVYPVGRIISKDIYDNMSNKSDVETLNFPDAATYYYCRENYILGGDYESYVSGGVTKTPDDNPITSLAYGATSAGTGSSVATTYEYDDEEITVVPLGTILNAANYAHVVNLQTNFSILGTAPSETATLYMARESDIDDLSQERIITLVYRYEYDESDETGMNVDHVVERHIINVHLTFLNGEPSVGKLEEPPLVLPNTTVGFREPAVETGAYEIIGGGFEIYDNIQDATKHQNGREYSNGSERVFWYQDGNYVSYYAKSYLGKTYSNNVRIKVANYHDIDELLNDPNYLYVDNPKVKRPSKIYIDDQELKGDNPNHRTKIDQLHDIFALSLYNSETETSVLNGHVRNCENLEFVLNSDVTASPNWVPIGNKEVGCFGGNIHGDGHTISGLDHSLFGSLCGNVYNLGVTGTFTGSGIADDGYIAPAEGNGPVGHSGIVSNSWIHTTSTAAKTKRPVYGIAVGEYGNSSLNSLGNKLRLLNCYYPKEDWGNSYTPDFNFNGELFGKPLSSFRNGEVAFDLNGYYLTKRYADAVYKKTDEGAAEYKFIATNPATGAITMGGTEKEPQAVTSTGYYKYLAYDPTDKVTPVQNNSNMGYPYYSIVLNDQEKFFSYVERHFGDGDFRYRWGVIPSTENVRTIVTHGRTEDDPDTYDFYPIWPDDYVFFGQKLTYGYDANGLGREHDELPTALVKSRDGRINYTPAQNNIVFRAPAYYRNSTMSNVFFNAYAVFADHEKTDENAKVHHNLTAVDFTGHNDISYAQRGNGTIFYPPVLSFTKLTGAETHDLTQNLLFYAPKVEGTQTAAGIMEEAYGVSTYNVLSAFVNEPEYAELDEVNDAGNSIGKHSVAMLTEKGVKSPVNGHIVVQSTRPTGDPDDSTETFYTTLSDHYLVDRNDFNAPVAYTMGAGKRMWYQRWPDNYVDAAKGWEAVSLPFESKMVTTQTKGEITHFYKKSGSTNLESGFDSGHEYWLREFTGIETTTGDPTVAVVNMTYPVQGNGDDKEDANTFLWNYYYSRDMGTYAGKDDNDDEYQNTFYCQPRTYPGYAFAEAATPYIVGFPGSRYYEFDLSGKFIPEGTKSSDFHVVVDEENQALLKAQGITFVSAEGIDVVVSDTQLAHPITDEDYTFTFHGNFLNSDVTSDGENYYLLNQEGSAFVKAETNNVSNDLSALKDLKTTAFRPYFHKTTTTSAPHRLVFGMGGKSQLGEDEAQETAEDALHKLNVRTKRNRIIVESQLDDDCTVRIISATGQLYDSYTICPGESVETALPAGIYLVNRTKVMVK